MLVSGDARILVYWYNVPMTRKTSDGRSTVAVLAQKGGAGKTTLSLHWAVAAEARGRRVAVLDTDPQASASAWAQRRLGLGRTSPAVFQARDANLEELVRACWAEGYDLILIDTMPRVERPSVDAAKVADLAVIPCGPSIIDIEAIAATIAITTRVRTPAAIVLNQGRPGSSINAQAHDLLSGYGLPLCPITVMRRAALADAFNDGRAVMELEPEGKGALEIRTTWDWIDDTLRSLHG